MRQIKTTCWDFPQRYVHWTISMANFKMQAISEGCRVQSSRERYLYIFIFIQISKKMPLWVSFKNKFWTHRCNSNRRSWLGRWVGEIDKSDFLFMSRKPESLERFQLCMSPNSIFKNCPFFYEWCNQPGKMSSFLFLHTHNEVQIISKWNLNF